jgi:hypothetical protein
VNEFRPIGLSERRRQNAVAACLAVLTLVGLLLLFGHWGYDDSFITFRYARSLLSGQGLVYNAGERTLSTTAPLYAILLAGLGWIWSDLPALSNLLSAVALVLSAATLFHWARDRHETAVGMVAALLLSLSPPLLMTFGAETCVYLLFILVGFWAYDRARLTLAAGALALAAMIRPDGLLAAGTLIAYHWIRRRPTPWRPIALYTALVGTWFVGLWFYFGSPLPVTLLSKQQQGQMAISTRFGAGLVEMVREYGRQPIYWLHGLLALIGLGRVVTHNRHWIPLLVWTGLYTLGYTLLGVSRYPWYYAPLVPALVVLVAEGAITSLHSLLRRVVPRLWVSLSAGLLLILLLAPLVTGIVWLVGNPDPRLELYREIGQWLQSHTPRPTRVGALEVGIVGYYAQRPMIDFAGLLQPSVALQFSATTTYQDSTMWAVQTYRPDYVLLAPDSFPSLIESPWFQTTYRPVRDFSDEQTLWLTLYRRGDSP